MREASFRNLLYEVREPAAWITVNRPDKLNALDRQTVLELVTASALALEDARVRVLVLSGSGERAFVAGADIREMSQMSPTEAHDFARTLQASCDRLERSPKPVLAALHGLALGGGLELALACHLRLAADTARFGQPEVGLGLIPGAGGTQRLPRLVGRGRALELILGGNPIDAAEAQRIGLVNQVVPAGELHGRVESWIALLATRSPLALARALEAVTSGSDSPLGEGLRLEASLFGLCFASEDMREGTRAFLEKRPPSFKGR